MHPIDFIAIGIAVISVTFATRCYWELRKWARQCQNARIAVAYNQRVQLSAPLIDWLTWANQLDKKQKETGRVVYTRNKVRVAILRPESSARAKVTINRIRSVRKKAAATQT